MRDKSIELLNLAIADELAAVHQYMFFHFHCDDQGYDLLSSLFKRTAIAEMLHIEQLADRILFLKGTIKMEAAQPVEQITDVKAMLEFSRKSEEEAIEIIIKKKAAKRKTSALDFKEKRKIFQSLMGRGFPPGLILNKLGRMKKEDIDGEDWE